MATQAPNPLLPAGYDILWSVIAVAIVAVMAVALWQSLRSTAHTGGQQLLWALLIVVAPLIGALAWFVLGRSRATDATSS